MEGQTATNPQTGEKIVFRNGAWQPLGGGKPQAPRPVGGPVYGPAPKPKDPPAPPSDFEVTKFNKGQQDAAFNQARGLRKDFDGLPEVTNYKKIISSYATSIKSDETPEGDQLLINSYAQMLNPTSTVMLGEYQATEQNQTSLDQIKSRIMRELKFDDAGRLLPESRARVREEMQNIASRANEAYNLRREEYRGLAGRYGFSPDEIIGPHLGTPFKPQIEEYRRGLHLQNENRQSDDGELSGSTAAGVTALPDGIPPDAQEVVRDSSGNVVGYVAADGGFVTTFRTKERQAYDERVAKAAQAQGDTGYTERADQGITLGLSDEAAGIGGAIGSLLRGENPVTGYQFSRDVQRFRNDQANRQTGLLGDAVEIGSSLFLPVGGAVTTPGRAAVIGGVTGGIGGFGYGEGARGSATNALLGASLGSAIGAGGAYAGNALANRATRRAADTNEMVAVEQAANELGMAPVPRIFSNPNLETRGRAVGGTIAGGQQIKEGVRAFGDSIEGAVNNLSTGTAIRNNEAAGGMVKEAAERQIRQTGESAKRSYDRAVRLAGNARVTPSQSVQLLDQEIAALSETAGLNSAEISFLQTLKNDFSKDLSVDALRRARTTLRKKISKGDLVFGENEARVLSVMDAAAADIEAGLRSQGKAAAAEAFRAADIKYRARMDYINGTLQKVIGKRDSNLSNEAIMRRFRGLATPGGDSEGLKKFYASLTPDEAADVSATFAEMLGRGGRDGTKDFSTATLVDNIEQLKKSGATMTTLFGREGAKSLDNILVLAREHKRVNGAVAGQGSAQGNDRRWMLASMLFPGAGTAAAGGDAVLTAGMAVTGFAIKAGRDALSAKLLMSPRFTGWMRSAPRTSNPKAINAHFAKLGAIAKAEPAIASEIGLFRETMLKAANDNANKAVAQESEQ